MAPTLYYNSASPPCHSVLLTAHALNVDLVLKHLDMLKEEHLAPEFVKINPRHTLPTLVDGSLVLSESRAIGRYLSAAYGGGAYYPAEPRARAVVDQMLDFDLGTLYQKYMDYYYPQFFDPTKKPLEADLKKLQEVLGFFNTYLEGSKYAAGNEMTLADFALVASIATIHASEIDLKPFANVIRWFELMKTTAPGYQEAVQKNVDTYEAIKEEWKNKKA